MKSLRRRVRKIVTRRKLRGGTYTKNVLGGRLQPCSSSSEKTTGFFRDGTCSTGPTDAGTHVVCAVMTDEFLQFTKSKGNDLMTATPGFPGLKAGDKWCLCALRWREAFGEGKAPPVILESTHESALQYIPLKTLKAYAHKRT
jgi:uncharacterized protein (DUF2237 family)